MKYIKYKLFWVWSYEKEEEWLNQMSKQGLQLVSVGLGRYVFTDEIKEKYNYRLEYLDGYPAKNTNQKYIKFLAEMDIEFVASFGTWAYFRKNIKKGNFEIYSDIDSKINHLHRMSLVFYILLLANSLGTLSNIFNHGNYKSLIYILLLQIFAVILMALAVYKIERKIHKLKLARRITE